MTSTAYSSSGGPATYDIDAAPERSSKRPDLCSTELHERDFDTGTEVFWRRQLKGEVVAFNPQSNDYVIVFAKTKFLDEDMKTCARVDLMSVDQKKKRGMLPARSGRGLEKRGAA